MPLMRGTFINPDTHEEHDCEIVLLGDLDGIEIEIAVDSERRCFADVWDVDSGQRFPFGPGTFADAMEWVVDTRAYVLNG